MKKYSLDLINDTGSYTMATLEQSNSLTDILEYVDFIVGRQNVEGTICLKFIIRPDYQVDKEEF